MRRWSPGLAHMLADANRTYSSGPCASGFDGIESGALEASNHTYLGIRIWASLQKLAGRVQHTLYLADSPCCHTMLKRPGYADKLDS